MSFEFEFGRKGRRTTRDWWAGLPRWLKLVYVFVAIPAWLTIAYFVLTGQGNSTEAWVAFAIFFGTALLFIMADRRREPSD